MREIKFRAWSGLYMYQVDKIAWNTEHDRWYTETEVSEVDSPLKVKQPILMQFTGLHDKNRKEIYEGDIVRCLTTNDEDIFVVRYTHHPRSSSFEVGHDEEYEIIGNIYENPELLNSESSIK